jgi:3-phosphoshikimate 1-carboxyvinyltransferase
MGARIAGSHGRPPLVGRGGPLWGAVLDLAAASAQAGSAVLLGALNASGRTVVRYPAPVRDHTERMLAAMGAPIEWSALESVLAGPCARLQPPAADGWKVPGDLSSAAFLAAAAAIVRGSEVQIDGVGLNPGRTGLLEILAHMGARLEVSAESLSVGEPVGRRVVGAAPICGVEVAGHLVPRAIDELPLVAVLGAVAQGVTHVRDAVELRVKESDRIAAMVAGLRAMGAHAEEAPDGYRVWGPSELHGARVSGRQDHRVVMALAVAALAAEGETRIQDAERIADSFPGFVETMTALGADMRLVQ